MAGGGSEDNPVPINVVPIDVLTLSKTLGIDQIEFALGATEAR